MSLLVALRSTAASGDMYTSSRDTPHVQQLRVLCIERSVRDKLFSIVAYVWRL